MIAQGTVELVEHFIGKCHSGMLEELSTLDLEQMTLKERIKAAIRARLKQYAPYIANWSQVLHPPAGASSDDQEVLHLTLGYSLYRRSQYWLSRAMQQRPSL